MGQILQNPYLNYHDYLQKTKDAQNIYATEHEKFQSQFKIDLPQKVNTNINNTSLNDSFQISEQKQQQRRSVSVMKKISNKNHSLLMPNSSNKQSSGLLSRLQIGNRVSIYSPNPNMSWDSRDSMTFRSKIEMHVNKETHEKKFSMRQSMGSVRLNSLVNTNASSTKNQNQNLKNDYDTQVNQSQLQNPRASIKQMPTSIRLQNDSIPSINDDLSPISSNFKNTFICQIKDFNRQISQRKSTKIQHVVQRDGPSKIINRPCQRDGLALMIASGKGDQKYLVVFGGDRFKRAFNDLFIYKL
eukprot:403366001